MVLYYIIFHMGIKAVVFDMDGLMFDTERVAAEGMLEALRAQGFEADERLLEKLLGVNTGDTLRILSARSSIWTRISKRILPRAARR